MKQPCLNVTYVKQSERVNEKYCNGRMHAVLNESPRPTMMCLARKEKKKRRKRKEKPPAVTSVRDKSTRPAPRTVFRAQELCESRGGRPVSTEHFFCRDKIMFVVEKNTKKFTTNICRDKHKFVATKVLSRKAYLQSFVATKVCLSQ